MDENEYDVNNNDDIGNVRMEYESDYDDNERSENEESDDDSRGKEREERSCSKHKFNYDLT